MALNNYYLRPPSTVILADNRDPYVSWQNHLARTGGLRGGVDLVAPVGTPVYARTDGRMIQIPNDGSAGNSCRFYHASNSGWKDVFSHLSSYRTPKNPSGLNAFDYRAGDIVAYTGNTGGVAPHLHWHLLDPNGNRQNPWNYFSGSTPAGGNTEPINELEKLLMPALIVHPNSSVGFVSDTGKLDAISDINEVNAILATGIVKELHPVTKYIWDLLVKRTNRLKSNGL